MNLTRNFTLSELIKSDTAIRKGINNNPNAEQIEKLKALCENILQPVRDHFGRVKITSGFRSVELCEVLLDRSMHVQKRPTSKLWAWITQNFLIGLKTILHRIS